MVLNLAHKLNLLPVFCHFHQHFCVTSFFFTFDSDLLYNQSILPPLELTWDIARGKGVLLSVPLIVKVDY